MISSGINIRIGEVYSFHSPIWDHIYFTFKLLIYAEALYLYHNHVTTSIPDVGMHTGNSCIRHSPLPMMQQYYFHVITHTTFSLKHFSRGY